MFYERVPVGGGVAGGMGGARITDGVWVHETLESLGLADAIRQVIAGELDRIPPRDAS